MGKLKFVKRTGGDFMKYLTFALAKGRLAKQTIALLKQIGITCEEINDPNTRKLVFVNEEQKVKFFLAKASDVPTYVEYGVADIGVVGKDTLLEEGRKLYEVLDLGFGACNMCVCGPEEAKEKLQHGELIRVATKYPNIAKEYFYKDKNTMWWSCWQSGYSLPSVLRVPACNRRKKTDSSRMPHCLSDIYG